MATLYVHPADSSPKREKDYEAKHTEELDRNYYSDKRPRRRDHYHHRMNFSPRHRKYYAAVHHNGNASQLENRAPHSASSSSSYYRPHSPHYHYQSPRHLNQRQYQQHEHSYSSSSYSKKKSSPFYHHSSNQHNPPQPRFQRQHTRYSHSNGNHSAYSPLRGMEPHGLHPNNLDADGLHAASNELCMSPPPNSMTTSLHSSQPASPSSTTVSTPIPHPPPSLFFPLNENHSKDTPDLMVDEPPTPHHSKHSHEEVEDGNGALSAVSTPSTQLHGLPNLCNLGAPPPLSALSLSDGKLLLSSEDLSILSKLSVSEIQNELNAQRLKNESLLAKLHHDQKKFLKVCKHYEKKNGVLKGEVAAHEQSNTHSVQSAKMMKNLLSEHQTECDLNQQEQIQGQISKSVLWKGVSTNMQLLSEVNALNKQIDSYHLLIAKKNQQLDVHKIQRQTPQTDNGQNGDAEDVHKEQRRGNINNSKDDQKDEEEADLCGVVQRSLVIETEMEHREQVNENKGSKERKVRSAENAAMGGGDDSKQMETEQTSDNSAELDGQSMSGMGGQQPFDTMSVVSGTATACNGDPLKNYADQLIARNKRYQQILALLRNKVDELRACRKKL